MKHCLLFFNLFFFASYSYPQEVYQNVLNQSVYNFIDELANNGIISVNSVIKPYSRRLIAEKLNEANDKISELNKRQQAELKFFLNDYKKELPGSETTDFIGKNYISKNKVPFKKRTDLFYYKDSLFSISINPAVGASTFVNSNGTNIHRWNGAEAYAYIGKNWGFYTSLRDNFETKLLSKKEYLTQLTGGPVKYNHTGGGDYEEVKGGISYAWKWGSLGLIKDNIIWGNNYNGANIISNRATSFPFLNFHINPVKWFDFTYIHGWLPSNVIDSLRSYTFANGTRLIYHDKYLAANMFTFTPFKRLNVSCGNSVIYSDDGVKPGFVIPFMFFKSVDHSQNVMSNYAGQNSQMFFDISSRQIKHLHLFTSVFIDELAISRMWDPEEETNLFSIKGGFALSDFPLQNLTLITEYTRTNPLVYKHFIPTTTFEANQYNMGHYLRDNSEEWFFALRYKPVKGLLLDLSYLFAQKGTDIPYIGGVGFDAHGIPFIEDRIWLNKTVSFNVKYEVFNDILVFAGFSNSDIVDNLKLYTPEYFTGNNNNLNFGINWGF